MPRRCTKVAASAGRRDVALAHPCQGGAWGTASPPRSSSTWRRTRRGSTAFALPLQRFGRTARSAPHPAHRRGRGDRSRAGHVMHRLLVGRQARALRRHARSEGGDAPFCRIRKTPAGGCKRVGSLGARPCAQRPAADAVSLRGSERVESLSTRVRRRTLRPFGRGRAVIACDGIGMRGRFRDVRRTWPHSDHPCRMA